MTEYKIRIHDKDTLHWEWCRDTLEAGSWKLLIGLTETSTTYCFTKPEDYIAFKLRFEL